MTFNDYQKLDRAEVNAILNKEFKSAKAPKDPLLVDELVVAVRNGTKSVIINGRRYVIRYEGEEFFVKPARGYVPCGWYNKKRVLDGI